MKPRLTVLVGAGASLEVGVPSTSELLDVCLDALRTQCRPQDARCSPESIVTSLTERCSEYFGARFNFEQLMHVLEAINSLGTGLTAPSPTTNLPVEAMLTAAPHPNIVPALDPLFSFSAPRVLVRALHGRITTASRNAISHENWRDYVEFWNGLATEFALNIASLNYDTVVDQALGLGAESQGFTAILGENVRRVDERLLRLGSAPSLMHLHGSIHFGRREYGSDPNRFCFEDDWHDWYWHPTPDSAGNALEPGVSAAQSGFRGYASGPLITGYDKTEKLLMDPFGTYLRAFSDSLRDNNRLLVVGYGFGDQHINVLLQRMARYHGDAIRIAVITKFDPIQMHGSWGPERGSEATMYHRWGRDARLLEKMNYSNPLCAEGGLLRVYYDGILDSHHYHIRGLLDFLKG